MAKMQTIPVRHIAAMPAAFFIRDVAEMMGGRDMIQDIHRHDFFFLLALKKASGSHEIDFEPYTVNDHCVFLLRPGQVHQLVLHSPCEGYLLHFTPDFYHSPLLREASMQNAWQLDSRQWSALYPLLQHIFQENRQQEDKYLDAIRASLDLFFIGLLRRRQQAPAAPGDSYIQQRYHELIALLETHLSHHKQVAWYAAQLHLSIYQLNNITKTAAGKNCSELINNCIILEAKRLLLATPAQVKEIACQLGYEDASYFVRFFRKHTGHAPQKYRQHFR